MYILDIVKDNIVFFTSSFQRLNIDNVGRVFLPLRAEASSIQDVSLSNRKESTFTSTQVKLNKPSSRTGEMQETRVYCIVNKYNELVKASSRLVYSPSIKSQPIYCLFVSKQDAIDFLYKIASNEPKAFKKSGLGINSFSLKDFSNLVEKSKNSSQVFLLNDLQELDSFMSKSKPSSKKFTFTYDKGVNFAQPFNGILAYRVNPSYKDNPFLDKYYLKIDDAVEQWSIFCQNNTDNIPKKYQRPLIQLCTLTQAELHKFIR